MLNLRRREKKKKKKMITSVKPKTRLGHTSPYSIEGTNIFQTPIIEGGV